jgi:tight adherence protein C
MGMEILLQALVSIVILNAVFLLIWSLFRFPIDTEPPIHRRIAMAVGAGHRQTLFENPVLAPVMSLALTASRRFGWKWLRDKSHRDLNAAGNPNGYSVDEHLAICMVVGAGMGAATGLIFLLFFGNPQPLAILGMAGVGFFGPVITLQEAARNRLGRVSKKLPYTLDLISLMMEAGSTFSEAIDTIIRDEPEDDFNQELMVVRSEIDFGTSRGQALAGMADRIPLDSLRSIVGAINQSEALGTPLSSILKSQSGMLRMHRSVRAEKLSASASLRILIPSMLILAAVVLVIFGPLIIRFLNGDLNFT